MRKDREIEKNEEEMFGMITEASLSRLHQHFVLCICATIQKGARNNVCVRQINEEYGKSEM